MVTMHTTDRARLWDLILRGWLYFRTGYGLYFVLALGIPSTAATIYYFIIKNAPWLLALFPSFELFLVEGALLFIPACIAVGYLHIRRSKAFKTEQDVYSENSPYMLDAQAVYAALFKLGEGLGVDASPELTRIRDLMKVKK